MSLRIAGILEACRDWRYYSLDESVVMFFALLLGARVAGLVGVFLSIPIAGVLISLLEMEEMQGN